jgi:hypothetical protein
MIMPRMHSKSEEWIKPGIEETCIIRAFDLRLQRSANFFLGRGMYFSHEKC